jgi:hypothetical protein
MHIYGLVNTLLLKAWSKWISQALTVCSLGVEGLAMMQRNPSLLCRPFRLPNLIEQVTTCDYNF